MAYKYEKVNHELLVPQIEDQLMIMHIFTISKLSAF